MALERRTQHYPIIQNAAILSNKTHLCWFMLKYYQNMKGSGSKDKATTPVPSQNRLNKTQVPPKPVQIMENTYYAQKNNGPESSKPIASQMPPRAGSSQKINFNVQANMTESKIMVAKQGLQLLKKKMSRNMSREKTSVEKKEEVQQPVSKKTIYKPAQEEEERESKKPTPKVNPKLPPRDQLPKKSPALSSKIIQDRPIQRQQPMSNHFVNDLEEAPLNSNQDFNAILERALAKEKNNMPLAPSKPMAAKKMSEYAEEDEEEVELMPCSKGCGRQFNPNVLMKHEKVCEKVFQSKRKAFNSAAFRQPDEGEGIKPPPPPPEPPKAGNKKADKIPKWKKESAAFRAGLKAGRGEALTQEQKSAGQDDMIQCPCCGRKFNETAGKRHIAFCSSKSKEMPKMNTSKRK